MERWEGQSSSETSMREAQRSESNMLCGEGEEVHEWVWQEMRWDGG